MEDEQINFEHYLPPANWKLENARRMRDATLTILRSHCYFTCTKCKRTSPNAFDLCSNGEAIARRKIYWSSRVKELEQRTRVEVPQAFYYED